MPKNEPEAARENSSFPIQKKQKKQDAQPAAIKMCVLDGFFYKLFTFSFDLYSRAEILYFKMWLELKKQAKTAKINKDK